MSAALPTPSLEPPAPPTSAKRSMSTAGTLSIRDPWAADHGEAAIGGGRGLRDGSRWRSRTDPRVAKASAPRTLTILIRLSSPSAGLSFRNAE